MHSPAPSIPWRQATVRLVRGAGVPLAVIAGLTVVSMFVRLARSHSAVPDNAAVWEHAVEPSRPAQLRPVDKAGAAREKEGPASLAALRAEIAAGGDGLARLNKIAETQPAEAIDVALVLGRTSDERDQWVTELTRAWAMRDPQATWDWLGQQVPRMERLANGSLIGVVLDAMATRAPQRVVENVDALLRRGDVPGVIPPLVACQLGLTALVAHGDVELAQAAVEEWARNPRALEIGASAYNAVADTLAQDSWADASAWLATLPASSNRSAAFAVLASKWGDRDPAAALEWAETLGAANGQFTAVQTVFSDWAERDGKRAAEWLSGYVDRAQSDAEIDQLIGSLITFAVDLNRDPKQALSWVNMMRDNQQRTALAERVAIRWARNDVVAATSFVETSDAFSAAQKQELKQKLIDQANDPEPIGD